MKAPHPTPTDVINSLFESARRLALSGHKDKAIASYLQILQRNDRHYLTLVNLAELLLDTGYTSAARTALQQAIAVAPQQTPALVSYGNLLLREGQLELAQEHYQRALAIEPHHCNAHRGMALVFFQTQAEEKVAYHHRMAFKKQPLEKRPYVGNANAPRILVLITGLSCDVPWERLIDLTRFEVTTLVVNYLPDHYPLPAHDVIFNAVGDADLSSDALRKIEQLQRGFNTPIINRPEAVAATGRLNNAVRLSKLPFVKTAHMQLVDKAKLMEGSTPTGWRYPFLLRSPGFQNGHHFEAVNSDEALAAICCQLPGAQLFMMEMLNARDPQGWYRKYRVMSIDGKLYPLHLALSDHWKIHYFSAKMAEHAEHRRLEADFLADMHSFLGTKIMHSLEAIQNTLGLEYVGIDFGLDAQGNLLVFEANATMVIAPPAKDPQWDYRRPSVTHALNAVQAMVASRAN